MGRTPDRLANYGMRESRKAHGMDFRSKSNFDPALHNQEKSVAVQMNKEPVKPVVEQAPLVEERGDRLRLTYPSIAEAPTFDFSSKEWGDDHDPRGIQAIGKSFYDEAVSAREAVYAYYEAHKGSDITRKEQKEYQRLYKRAEKRLNRLQIIRNLVDLVQQDLSGEAIKSRASEMRQSIATSLAEFDAKEASAEISKLIAQDIKSLGGVMKWLWDARKTDRRQFAAMARIGGVLLFGTIVPLSQAACQVTVEPGVPAQTTEPTDEAPETADPATQATEQVQPTDPAPVEQPTDQPATPTAEAAPTAIPSNVSFAPEVADTTQRNAYYLRFVQSGIIPVPPHLEGEVQVNPGVQPLVSEHSLRIDSDRVAVLTGDAADYEGVGYGPGDIVVLNVDGTFDRVYGHLVYDGQNAVDVSTDPTYTFSLSEGVPTWSSSDPNKDTYIWVEWFSDGEFITAEFMGQQVELMQQQEDLSSAQAYAQANGLAPVDHIVYDDETLNGSTVGYDAAGNPVVQRENEGSQWVEVEPQIEGTDYAFGPDGESISTLRGEPMPDAAHTIVYSGRTGWSVGSESGINYDSPSLNFVTPDEFLSILESEAIVNSPQAMIKLEQGIGPNFSIKDILPTVAIGFNYEEFQRTGDVYNSLLLQTFVRDKRTGELYKLIFDYTVFIEGYQSQSLEYRFSHLGPDGLPVITTSNRKDGIAGFDGDLEDLYTALNSGDQRKGFYLLVNESTEGPVAMSRAFINEPRDGLDVSAASNFEPWAAPPGNAVGWGALLETSE